MSTPVLDRCTDAVGAVAWTDETSDDRKQQELGLPKHSTWTIHKKLDLAHQVVEALADVHEMNVPTNGHALVSYGDVDITQFVSVDGGKHYKISDFNGAQWAYYDKDESLGGMQILSFHASWQDELT